VPADILILSAGFFIVSADALIVATHTLKKVNIEHLLRKKKLSPVRNFSLKYTPKVKQKNSLFYPSADNPKHRNRKRQMSDATNLYRDFLSACIVFTTFAHQQN